MSISANNSGSLGEIITYRTLKTIRGNSRIFIEDIPKGTTCIDFQDGYEDHDGYYQEASIEFIQIIKIPNEKA